VNVLLLLISNPFKIEPMTKIDVQMYEE